MNKQWKEINSELKKSIQNRLQIKEQWKKKKKNRVLKKNFFIHQEGAQYKSGPFHWSGNKK